MRDYLKSPWRGCQGYFATSLILLQEYLKTMSWPIEDFLKTSKRQCNTKGIKGEFKVYSKITSNVTSRQPNLALF